MESEVSSEISKIGSRNYLLNAIISELHKYRETMLTGHGGTPVSP